ncbi:murein hydrolase activator EnvC family protein [Vibrio sp. SCSIO 43137]|uniref:murein hydrolase activator EnvC family protein n=1 Tax=Vibrio sp. SCSIO 43137 TaxID=3021011 RepID=UPI002306FF12|nr:murein hydrolase activator EnvC [Vibrio sp. SCSIO 43137]WCE29894.1 murein hydrolase activator EnvC [Vibrio sp. SCSIO 43137]
MILHICVKSVSQSVTYALISAFLLFSLPGVASQDELKGVKSEISRQQSSVTKQQKELNSLQQSLKKQELSISSLSREIKQTQSKLNQANKNLSQFHKQKAQLEKRKEQQELTLSELIKTYYIIKQNSELNGLSIKEQTEEQARISKYFQHLTNARAKAIKELNNTAGQLEEKNRQLIQKQKQIKSLLAQQTSKRDQLASSQKQRKRTVNKIKSNISNDKNYLAELQRNETRLKSEIAKAAKRNTIPMDGLARQKGKLPWPVHGRILNNYGSRQNGQVNWKGMVIDVDYEQPVKAVYSGTVVFADYLRGYGLVVLLDHGKGDMTLYGFNQTLLKVEGDKVAAGETIALAGDTGGQPQASLYFEIRRNSKTQNPKSWLTR